MKSLCYVMLFLFVVIGGLIPEESDASYCDQRTHILFGNGMFNSLGAIRSSVNLLETKTRAGGNIDNSWVFGYSHNFDEGKKSFLEVSRQRINDQSASFWRWLGHIDVAPDWFQETARTIAEGYDLHEAIIDENLQQHIQRYESLLLEGNRVLIAAHSQGNLYANAAYTNLAAKGLPMDSFGIVSVATPASYVAGDGPYYTLVNDIIIGGVRLLFPNTLEPNVANIYTLDDWSQHSFVTSYLKGNASGPLIINSILSEAQGLAWPEAQLGKGPISVTLTWGEQPDMDLHIFEPNLSHVYYADPVGISGYLDRDDSSQYGPEHYYVDCTEALQTGLYKVAVNYYRGTGMETAQIQIQAGDVLRDYTVPMYLAMGSTGNFRSWRVATIDVTEKPEGGYAFKVDGR